MNRIQRTEDPAFARDLKTKMVINTDDRSYAAYIAERNQRQRMVRAVDEVDNLKKQIDELRSIVAYLTSSNTKQNGSS